MPRYTFTRLSLVEEIFTVQARNETAALDMVRDGHPSVEMSQGGWVDWGSDDYSLADVEDELVTFIRSKE